MDFYITLPSDGSPNDYAKNTPSKFRNKLPNSIELEGNWSCALVEISYPHSWANVRWEDCQFSVAKDGNAKKNSAFISMTISPGNYEDIGEITSAINDKLSMLKTPEKNIVFKYNKVSRKVTIEVKNGAAVNLDSGLSYILGFRDEKLIEKTAIGRFQINLSGGVTSLFVYSDIITPQVYGNTSVPLLRIVNIDGSDGEEVTKTFSNPHYVTVNRKFFETVDIIISDDHGKPITFESGRCIVKLHFKRVYSKFF